MVEQSVGVKGRGGGKLNALWAKSAESAPNHAHCSYSSVLVSIFEIASSFPSLLFALSCVAQLLSDRISHPMTRAGVLSVLHSVTRRNPGALAENVIVHLEALKPLINMFDQPIVPLINKAHAAGGVAAHQSA